MHPDKAADFKNLILSISSERKKEEVEEEEDVKEKSRVAPIPTIMKISADYQSYYLPHRNFKTVNIHKHLLEAKSYVEDHIKTIQLRSGKDVKK
jgi:hypothetical protein